MKFDEKIKYSLTIYVFFDINETLVKDQHRIVPIE